MSAAPYMRVYIADYTADVQHLTCEQDGAYWRLLRAMWRAGGKLPNKPDKLARICGLSPKRWAEIGPDVKALFQVRGGQLVHKRLAAELAHTRAVSDSKRRTPKGPENGSDLEKPKESKRRRRENAPPNAGIYQSHITPLSPPRGDKEFSELVEALPLPPEVIRTVVAARGPEFAYHKLSRCRWLDQPKPLLVAEGYGTSFKLLEFCRVDLDRLGVEVVTESELGHG